jgi:hypothetical protein
MLDANEENREDNHSKISEEIQDRKLYLLCAPIRIRSRGPAMLRKETLEVSGSLYFTCWHTFVRFRLPTSKEYYYVTTSEMIEDEWEEANNEFSIRKTVIISIPVRTLSGFSFWRSTMAGT